MAKRKELRPMKHVIAISQTPQKAQDIPLSAIISAIASILAVVGEVLGEKNA